MVKYQCKLCSESAPCYRTRKETLVYPKLCWLRHGQMLELGGSDTSTPLKPNKTSENTKYRNVLWIQSSQRSNPIWAFSAVPLSSLCSYPLSQSRQWDSVTHENQRNDSGTNMVMCQTLHSAVADDPPMSLKWTDGHLVVLCRQDVVPEPRGARRSKIHL